MRAQKFARRAVKLLEMVGRARVGRSWQQSCLRFVERLVKINTFFTGLQIIARLGAWFIGSIVFQNYPIILQISLGIEE